MDIRTLQYWHKLEHFYPYILQDQHHRNITSHRITGEEAFPSFPPEGLDDDQVVSYYEVYLGIFRLDSALDALDEGLGQKTGFRDTGEDKSCFCKMRLDSSGRLQLDHFRISAFPWAVHWTREGHMPSDEWDDAFAAYETDMFLHLANLCREPVNYGVLSGALDHFAKQLNWEPAFSPCRMRIDCITDNRDLKKDHSQSPETEERESAEAEQQAQVDRLVLQNGLLNSFYVRDLERILRRARENPGAWGESFRRYVAHSCQEPRVDLEHSPSTLLDLLDPDSMPKGKWPGRYGLRLMQQADVNAFMKDKPALFSVNGPPGTGKTTLLKDCVAAIVVDRARALCELDQPDDAFGDEVLCTVTTVSASTGKSYTDKIHGLKPQFRRHGIVVASSNNGAVENISHALPLLQDLPEECRADRYRYFSEVGDRIFGDGNTWGLCAAALGNKTNREVFADAFWPLDGQETESYNFRKELWDTLRSASPWESRNRWDEAKRSFYQALSDVEWELMSAREIYPHVRRALALAQKLREADHSLAPLAAELEQLENRIVDQTIEMETLASLRQHHREHLAAVRRSDPFLPVRQLFRRSQWAARLRDMRLRLEQDDRRLAALEQSLEQDRHTLDRMRGQLSTLQKRRDTLCQQHQTELAQLERFQAETGSPCRLDRYFTDATGEAGKSSPWSYPRLNRLREILFLEAMQLHRAFVLNSALLRDNLDAFSKLLRSMLPPDKAAVAASPLLQSFFLMVPVVSTTFASVATFLADIPPEDIGYLFIDEAGQAAPQAAAGAIWRSRRVIAVGDPLQIEPVITLHDSVMEDLGKRFGQDQVVTSKFTSVQTLADLANPLGGYRTLDTPDDLWIGAPLLVHSRCQRGVFDIANKIAYNSRMIYATQDRAEPVCQWRQVTGSCHNGHFVLEQAKEIFPIVLEAFVRFSGEGGAGYPSLFVITPFRSVRDGLVNYFHNYLYNSLVSREPDLRESQVRAWIGKCVGTIHTFQGKEADTVILCLGADSGGRDRKAVEWACQRPNILNVAVTRSRHHLYIVGDRKVWAQNRYFATAARICGETQPAATRLPEIMGGISQ